jgi:FecR protein
MIGARLATRSTFPAVMTFSFIAPLATYRLRITAALLALPVLSSPAFGAAPENFNVLKFKEVVDKVMVIDASTQRSRLAVVNEAFKVPDQVSTGANSRAELIAPDGTVTRVGANTVFSFAADKREVKLQKGSLLFHSPSGKGGGVISSEGAQAAVMGTTLIVTATPSGGFKLLVLEGKAKATLSNGDSIAVTAGQLTVVSPGKAEFGPVLNFRLKDQVAGSSLLKGFRAPVASEGKVLASVEKQERMIADGRAEPTRLRVRGEHLMEEGNVPPPLRRADVLRLSEAVKGINIDIAMDAAISFALGQNVGVLGQHGKEPGSSLFGSGKTPLSFNELLSRLKLSPGSSVPQSLASVFGESSYSKLKLNYGDKFARLLLANNLEVRGLDPDSTPSTPLLPGESLPPLLEHFTGGGSLAEFLFPDLRIDLKIIAATGAVLLDDSRTDAALNLSSPTPMSPSESGELSLTQLTSELAGAQGPVATEKLLLIQGRSVTVNKTLLNIKSEAFVLGLADASVSPTIEFTKTVVFNRSGSVEIAGSSITAGDTSVYARGNVLLTAITNISINEAWAREFTAPNSTLRMVAGVDIDIASTGPATKLNAASISLDARTINLTNVDFQNGSIVRLASKDGVLAASPNTNQGSKPFQVNFISGVKYGGDLIKSTSTTNDIQRSDGSRITNMSVQQRTP